jgi:polysaccharide export outer membrane protein
MIIKKVYLALFTLLSMTSCVTYDSLVNFSDPPGMPAESQTIENFEPVKIQPSDILSIRISSNDALAVQPFMIGGTTGEQSPAAGTVDYLVNSRGEITFPTLGRIPVLNLEPEAVADTILSRLAPYFSKPPIVDVALVNFKINVNGEVNNPGIFSVQNERVTILDALTLAGDLTSYSRRDSILIVRERDGVRSFGYIDLNTADAFNSPYFYLKQNDVVYVRPEKNKTSSVRDSASRFLPWVSVIVSLTAVTVSVLRLR